MKFKKISAIIIFFIGVGLIVPEPVHAAIFTSIAIAVGSFIAEAGITAFGVMTAAVIVGTVLDVLAIGYAAYGAVKALSGNDQSPGQSSPTYSGPHPAVTVEQGTPTAWSVGFCRVGGNIVRQNDINDTTTDGGGNSVIPMTLIVCHGEGEWDEILGHYVNNAPWGELAHPFSSYWEHLGTPTQSGVDNAFGANNFSNYRNKVVTEYRIVKYDKVPGLTGLNVVARCCKCLEIGQDTGGTTSWTRDPAQILWHFYLEKEKRPIAELDQNAFTALSAYCSASMGYTDNYSSYVAPLVIGANSIKSTSTTNDAFYAAWQAAMKASVIGSATGKTASWQSSSATNQRYNIDFGRKVVVTLLAIENGFIYANPTYTTNIGIKNFILQGSNTLADFNDTTYTDVGSNWVNVKTGLQAVVHTDTLEEVMQNFTIENHTAYRYYSIKIADNWGATGKMSFRKIRCYGGRADSSVATEEYNNRYTFDYTFDSKIEIHDAKKIIWNSFHGQCVISQGKIKPVWDGAQEHDGAGGLQTKTVKHAFVVSTNVIDGSFSWRRNEKANIFIINFLDSTNKFSKDTMVVKDTDDIAIRGEITHEETCYYLIDRASAKRRLRRNYNQNRYTDWTCSLTGFPDSQALELFDRVTVTDSEAGWTAKDFFIIGKDEDQYGRPAFTLAEYFSGVYSDQGYEEQPGYPTRPQDSSAPMMSIDSDEVTASIVAPGASDTYVAGSLHVVFTPSPTAINNEIWLSTDDTNYSLAAMDVDGDVYIPGLGVFYDAGDTVYVKVVSVGAAGTKTEFPTTANDTVAIPSTGTLSKLASFYAGLYDLWAGNSDIANAATKIVLGGLDGTPKLALGASADSMTLANAATYPGFFADGDGNFRAGGGANKCLIWDVDGDELSYSGKLYTATPGDVRWNEYPSGIINGTTTSKSYEKEFGITIGCGGELRVVFYMYTSGGTAYGRVYRNGVAVGTEQSTSSLTPVIKTEDIDGWSPGDEVQLYIKVTAGDTGTYYNFYVAGTDIPIARYTSYPM